MTDDAKQPDVPLTEGEVLAGKYKVERILGRGGMGVVVAATHLHLRQRVAIKFLLPDATGEVVKRFLREARSAVRLKSEHVTRVLDVGELEGGAPFMVMEYLEGSDLSRVLRKRGALPIQEAIDYTLQACEAIAEAHSLGIVHRDLKPANLFVTTGADGAPIVKVLDFGISKDSGQNENGDEENQLTRTTAVLGSPYYMAPEQMRSTRSVDARADIWSLGIILYQLVTKKVPFKADSFVELALMVVNEDPKPPSTLRPDLPPALEEAILHALKKKPDERFSNVAEFAAAIAPFGPSSAIGHATRIARVQGAPVPSIALIERPSSVSIAPPAAGVGTGSGSGPQSVATPSVPSTGLASALSSGPSIPQAAQVTHASPTAAPAHSIPPPAGQTTGSNTESPTNATGAAWTGSTPTVQAARRTGAWIVGGGVVVGAMVMVGLLLIMRPHGESGSSHAATSTPVANPVNADSQRVLPAATGTVEVSAGTAVPVVSANASASASASPAVTPAPVGTGKSGPSSLTNRASSPSSPATATPAPPPVAPPPVVTPPPAQTAAAAPPPAAPAPTAKKNVLDIDIK